jgi:hypothetical protein
MHECHQAYKRGSDLANIELFVEEGLQYFFIMSQIRHYDTSKQYIGPAFEILDDAEMQVETNEKLTFFTSRWRRYEIARLRALPGGYN